MLNELRQDTRIDKKNALKTVGFFVILYLIACAAVVLKFEVGYLRTFIYDISRAHMYGITFLGIWFFMVSFVLYLVFTRQELISSSRDLYAIGVGFIVAFIIKLYLAMLSIYALPTMLAVFILAPVAKKRDAFITNIFCNFILLGTLLIKYVYILAPAGMRPEFVRDAIMMFTLGVTTGTVAAYTVWRKASRFSQIIRAFLFSTFFYGMIVMFDAVQGARILGHGLAYGALHGLVAGFAPLLIGMLLQPVLESVFNLLTDTRLVGFTDINAPLIKRLSVEAPGTFSHSLVVASFAEMCASSIGVNPYLARACAYYHDIGKLENPEYFKENQDEVNHHDNLLPEVSAEIVRAHTYGGLELCEKHRIPKEIAHVTVQHHGTMLISVFYEKAKSLTDGEVAKEGYRYQGITPRSKVAAIIMLCDAAEAALRVMEQPNAKKVDKLLSDLISDRIASRQFDRCDISLAELNLIKKTITQAYGGIYHARIKYPTGESVSRVSNREVKREEGEK